MWVVCLIIFGVFGASYGIHLPEDEFIKPRAENNNHISYFLYSGANVTEINTNYDVEDIPLNEEVDTVILVHGHRGHHNDEFSIRVRSAFIEHHDSDVIVMNWAFLASEHYLQVVRNVRAAAEDLSTLLAIVKEAKDNKYIHIVGFDIGAHVAGNAGRGVKARFDVDRITGLSPTGRSYGGSNTLRLSRNDATYVEIIHTDGGLFGNGIGTAIGHSDFFVNGGFNQPGCLTNSCCHRRSWEIFEASLHPQFVHLGFRCDSMIQVNLNTCRGLTLHMGDATINKGVPTPDSSTLYRANTGKIYPYV